METLFLVDHFKAKPNSPFIKLWTDSAWNSTLVKVKYEHCLLSWLNIKIAGMFLCMLNLAAVGTRLHLVGCGEEVVGTRGRVSVS